VVAANPVSQPRQGTEVVDVVAGGTVMWIVRAAIAAALALILTRPGRSQLLARAAAGLP
jgi:hypothetical protein